MVLVIGAAGLLGSELVRALLDAGEHVRALYHRTVPEIPASPKLELFQADLLDVISLEQAMENVTEVYNCAGLVSFHGSDASLLYKINVEGTSNLVNAALAAGVRKLVHASSVAALGRIRQNQLVNETMNWTKETSNSIYGHSKYLGEVEVWRGMAEGLDAVVVNPVIILGPGDWNEGSTKIFKSVYEEFPWYTQGVTGFVDVRDVAAAMMQLMKSDISGERFILSEGDHEYKELFDLAAACFHKRPPYKKVTAFMAGLVWRMQSIKSKLNGSRPLLTRETASTAMAKVHFDNSKLKKYLPGFQYHSFQDSIQYTCRLLQQKINKQ